MSDIVRERKDFASCTPRGIVAMTYVGDSY